MTLPELVRQDVAVLAIIALVAALLGLLRMPALAKEPPATQPSAVSRWGLAEAQKGMAAGALFIDARPGPFFQLGHLPGAINLPKADWQRAWAELTPKPPLDAEIIVYCSGESCSDSMTVAQSLVALGYRRVHVFEGGTEAWEAAGLPLQSE